MKAIHTIIAAVAISMTAAASARGAFEATPADKDLKTLLTRWAGTKAKGLVWEAPWNAPIKDAALLNEAAKLSVANDFNAALSRLNLVLANGQPEADTGAPSWPLHACEFSDVIVIRSIQQNDCRSANP